MMERVAVSFAEGGRIVGCEVPFFERRIDLVAVDPVTGDVTVVEGKIKDWQRGVAQIILAQTCAHISFLAVPQGCTSRVPREVLQAWRIGLIGVDGQVHVEVEAPPVQCTNPHCVRMVREAVGARGEWEHCR